MFVNYLHRFSFGQIISTVSLATMALPSSCRYSWWPLPHTTHQYAKCSRNPRSPALCFHQHGNLSLDVGGFEFDGGECAERSCKLNSLMCCSFRFVGDPPSLTS